MKSQFRLLAGIAIMLISGCIDSSTNFDLSSSIIKDLDLADGYILTCHIPKDTSINYYKLLENRKNGYIVRGAYLTNEQGKTEFYIYELTSGTKSLNTSLVTRRKHTKQKHWKVGIRDILPQMGMIEIFLRMNHLL